MSEELDVDEPVDHTARVHEHLLWLNVL